MVKKIEIECKKLLVRVSLLFRHVVTAKLRFIQYYKYVHCAYFQPILSFLFLCMVVFTCNIQMVQSQTLSDFLC